MVPFTTFFCTLYHHTHEKTRLLVKVVPERSPPTSTSFDTNSGTLLHEERGHRLSSHRSSLAQRRGVLAEQADFGERALRDFCGTYVRRCVDMGGAGDRASFGQAEVHTQRTAWGARWFASVKEATHKMRSLESVPFLRLEAI